jgi:KDO2-lipid IV(A) lauroyltransferase
LKAGRTLALVADRDILGSGVDVEFFGETTTLPAGPATLALRTGAPLLPVAMYFRPRGGHQGVIRPPMDVTRTGKFRADVTRLTQALAHEMETFIRAAPEQWHLVQPNWPSDVEALRRRRPQMRKAQMKRAQVKKTQQ